MTPSTTETAASTTQIFVSSTQPAASTTQIAASTQAVSSTVTQTTETGAYITYIQAPSTQGAATQTSYKKSPTQNENPSTSVPQVSNPSKGNTQEDSKLKATEESEPKADAGGPYVAGVGIPVTFNASKSSAASNITQYLWNYGDGNSSEGMITQHTYLLPGTYRATLSVVDAVGRSDLDSRAVYVSQGSIYVDIEAYPLQDRYNYGDALSAIEASVYRADGSAVDGASVSGTLSGRINVSLEFIEIGNGKYQTSLDYPIITGEEDFIDIYANAIDPSGNNASSVKKLVLVPKDSDLRLIVQDPVTRSFAYGETVDFNILFDSSGKSMDAEEVVLYEDWTNNKYFFNKEGKRYLLTYGIMEKSRTHIPLILYGSAMIEGKKQRTVKDLGFDLSHDLTVEILSPRKGDDLSKTKEVRIHVTYPDGKTISDTNLTGTIQESRVSYSRTGEDYAAPYTYKPGDSKIYVWVTDRFGNGGGAGSRIRSEESVSGAGGWLNTQNIQYAAVGIVLLAVLLASSRIYLERRKKKTALLKEYSEVMEKINSLKELRKTIMHEYYTRKTSETDTRKRILDFEQELVLERGRLKQVMLRLGMKYTETEGKEDILEWIVQKLSQGEEPELLKKGLQEMGLDPSLVDRVKKTLK